MDEVRVELVADDNADADPRIPKDVLEKLGPDEVLMGPGVMYIRASSWERFSEFL
jgi:hypothetical protein